MRTAPWRLAAKKMEQKIGDIDSEDLALEVKSAVNVFLGHISSAFEMLNHIYKENVLDLYANLSLALRLLLTVPVTVASGEQSFSCLKLIKTYLRSTKTQEQLTGLAQISTEHQLCRSLDYDLILAFATVNVCKVNL